MIVGTVTRIIKELRAQPLIEWPINLEILFTSHKQMVEILIQFFVCQYSCPESELIHIAFKTANGQTTRIGNLEFRRKIKALAYQFTLRRDDPKIQIFLFFYYGKMIVFMGFKFKIIEPDKFTGQQIRLTARSHTEGKILP